VADPLTVPAGRQLAHEGAPARQFVLILDGSFTASNGSGARELRAGDHFGLDELVTSAPSDETITASTPSEVLVLGRRETLGLLFSVPRLARRLLDGCAARRRPWLALVR
jgi:CRP-like cAMP-binding protein